MSIDDLLSAWAASVALPDQAAARIRAEILDLAMPGWPAGPRPGLPAAWWVQHNKQLADLIVRSTRRTVLHWAA